MSLPNCVYHKITGVNPPVNSSCCHDGTWNSLSSWKNKWCLGFLKWHSVGSVESHSMFGNSAVYVISAQPVGWRAILQALWINLWQDISRIKQNWMFNLTCPRAESSPVISRDREAWMWPTLGLNTTFSKCITQVLVKRWKCYSSGQSTSLLRWASFSSWRNINPQQYTLTDRLLNAKTRL